MKERLRYSTELRLLYGWTKTIGNHAPDPAVASLVRSALELLADAGKLAIQQEEERGAAPASPYEPAQEG